MTISSTTRVAGPFIGTGSASVFPFTFKVFAGSDLVVVRTVTSTGVDTNLVLNSDYTVTLNGNQNTNPGGSVTLSAGNLASGYELTITSDIANLQPTDLTNQGGFYPEVITDSLDRATIQIQQMDDGTIRSLKAPVTDALPLDMTLPNIANRAGKFLTFDGAGEPTVSSGTGTDTALRTDLANQTAVSAGASLVGFRQSDANAVGRTTLAKLRDVLSVKDFGATADGVTNDATAFTNAATAAGTRNVFVPGGSYAITGTVTGNFYTDSTVTIVGGTVNTINQIGSTLSTTGNATVGGNLSVTGTTALTGNATLTGDLAVNGADITTTATGTATVFNTNATTLHVGGAATTVSLGASAGTVSVGNLSMNAGYGSIAPVYGCRSWVNFDGTTNANVSATYSQSGFTVTVTYNNHGYIAGHWVYVDATSGTGVDGYYQITSVATNTFTYTAATSLTTSGNCNLVRALIRASANVHSVTFVTTGTYILNFSSAMPDTVYCITGASGGQSGTSNGSVYIYDNLTSFTRTTAACALYVPNTAGSGINTPQISVAVFR